MARVGIIGGTGLGELLEGEVGGGGGQAAVRTEIDTPFGSPSAPPIVATLEGVEVVFISRHGPGHTLHPSAVPYRANIWALKHLGVSCILASGATGSLREDIAPGQLVVCDQVIDKTFRRAGTFFDEGIVGHVELADPFCPRLRSLLVEAGEKLDATVHAGGTYVCMEGPQFSTRAESHMHRQWGGDLIGMTCMPEAKLAREAEMCYALVAFPTDYDCWRPHDSGRAGDDLLREILANLEKASRAAVDLIRRTLPMVGEDSVVGQVADRCACGRALDLAVWSDKKVIDPAARRRLGPLLDRYLGKS